MMEGLVGVYDLDHNTTPEVVRISKVSNILNCWEMSIDEYSWPQRIAGNCVFLSDLIRDKGVKSSKKAESKRRLKSRNRVRKTSA